MKMFSKNELKKIRGYLKYISKYKKKVIILYFFSISSNIFELFPIFFMGNIINYVVKGEFEKIINTIFIMLIFFVISTTLSAAETYISNLLINSISNELKVEVFHNFTQMTIGSISEMGFGNLMTVLENDTGVISKFFIEDVLNIIISLCTAVVSFFFLTKLSLELTLISVCFTPIIYFGYALFGKYIRKVSFLLKGEKDCNISYINNGFENIKEIKNCCIEENVSKKYNNMINRILKYAIKSSNLAIASSIFSMTISSISEWVIIIVGCWKIINGNLLIGNYVSFNGYLQKFMQSINGILNLNIVIQNVIVSSERITRIIQLEKEDYERGVCVEKIQGDIKIRNLSCGYGGYENVIQELDITFKKNNIYVIVGVNGSGKTTLFNAIMRFIGINEGNIYIDKTEIRDIKLHSLRKEITYVQQGNPSFAGSIKEIFWEVDATLTEQEIAKICAQVNILKLIESLPEKYNTIIGREGAGLSGGEYRKILIARALAKKSKILLLDEITSDLDGESEREILMILKELADSHTIILISHRVSSIINIPNIYVMDKGKIIAKGSHRELLDNCKKYKILVESQLKDRM